MKHSQKYNIVAFIFARKGSKGLKGKNLKKLNNKYLIDFSISAANKLGIKKIVVSSNIEKILNYAKNKGLFTIPRPKKLCLDDSPEHLAWKHAIKYYQNKKKEIIDIFVCLPLVSPLRKAKDTREALKHFKKNFNKVDLLVSVNKSDVSPNFNLLKKKKNYLKLFSNKKIFRRQDAEATYKITPCFYITKPDYILKNDHLLNGKIQGYEVDKLSSIDINDLEDYKLCQLIYKNKYGN